MMHSVIKGILIRMLVATCILMQLAVVMPHHHHDNGGMPCMNIFHCGVDLAEKQQHTCGCCGHCADQTTDTHHHDTNGKACVCSLTDMIRPERERIEGPSKFAVQLFAVQTVLIRTIHDADATICLNTLVRLDRKRPGVGVAIHTEYIAAAIPPRAPSFTA